MDIRALIFNSDSYERNDLSKMNQQELYNLYHKDSDEGLYQAQMFTLDEFSCAFNDEEISDQDWLYFIDMDNVHEPDFNEKCDAIIQAAKNHQFTDEIDEIDMLSYIEQDESGAERIVEDRFDYIDTTTIPISVHFICGTGYPDRNINLCRLTEESINTLYNCIDK